MDLWKNLDKITSQLKDCPTKVLMLDFDGTLAPIVQSPKEAKLSIETRDLLQKLCRKPNLYLAIVSGRELEDIKKKIGLPDIIYGGNHGLEGEIFGKKYSFPVTNQTITALKRIQGELERISGQFKGTLVENKILTLSFHYRMANTGQVSKILDLFDKTLKPYIGKKLVFTVTGKRVIDIVPYVNWNKGYFADFILRQIMEKARKHPIAVVIGDDETDEDTFKYLKRGITIVVGQKHQSKAKYYLKNSGEVVKFLRLLNAIL